MNDGAQRIRTKKEVVYPQIYSYTLPDEQSNDGSQKIGYTRQELNATL